MEKNKKYLTGIVVIATVGLFAHQLGYYQANSSIKKSNRVSYIDGKQAVQKSEELTPDEVSKKEGINAEQLLSRLLIRVMSLLMVITIIIIMGKFHMMLFSAKIF